MGTGYLPEGGLNWSGRVLEHSPHLASRLKKDKSKVYPRTGLAAPNGVVEVQLLFL
jgi:hypothetical protein